MTTPHIVTLLNQKGGVGKTSTAYHLAGTLAQAGQRVLLIDNDPQASLTAGFWGPQAARNLDPSETIVACYDGSRPLAQSVLRPVGFGGIQLLPGSPALAHYNGHAHPELAPEDEQRGIDEFLGDCGDAFDVVLIDCPPNLHLCSWAALVASHVLVVPLQPEDFGAQGLAPVAACAERCRRAINPALALCGYLVNQVDRRRSVHRTYLEVLRREHGDRVFAAVIPNLAAFPEAIMHRTPISHHAPRSTAAVAMQLVASELMGRLATLDNPRPAEVPLG
jgi:chromosome partitioning protein